MHGHMNVKVTCVFWLKPSWGRHSHKGKEGIYWHTYIHIAVKYVVILVILHLCFRLFFPVGYLKTVYYIPCFRHLFITYILTNWDKFVLELFNSLHSATILAKLFSFASSLPEDCLFKPKHIGECELWSNTSNKTPT